MVLLPSMLLLGHTLFPHSRHQLENHLLQGPYEEQLVRRFLLHLPQEGALAQAEIPAATAAWLQTSLSCTWFTTSLHRDKVQQTVKGTVPGAPLADILFQYVFRAAVATIAETLNCEGHSFSIVGEDGPLSAEPTSWLDDLTLIVQADAAMDLGPRDRARRSSCRAVFGHNRHPGQLCPEQDRGGHDLAWPGKPDGQASCLGDTGWEPVHGCFRWHTEVTALR